jgi:hypothetical protein
LASSTLLACPVRIKAHNGTAAQMTLGFIVKELRFTSLLGRFNVPANAIAISLLSSQSLLAVTQALSGASRATIDACRTIVIWAFRRVACWLSCMSTQFFLHEENLAHGPMPPSRTEARILKCFLLGSAKVRSISIDRFGESKLVTSEFARTKATVQPSKPRNLIRFLKPET